MCTTSGWCKMKTNNSQHDTRWVSGNINIKKRSVRSPFGTKWKNPCEKNVFSKNTILIACFPMKVAYAVCFNKRVH